MRASKKVRFAAASVVIAAGGTLAALGPASPAVAFFSPPLFLDVAVDSPATLVARGAAVDVPVEVTCTSNQASVVVTLTEAVGGHAVATGSGFATVGCTNARERILVTVTAVDTPFRKGTAFAAASVNGCTDDFSFCGTEQGSATIGLHR